MMLIKEKTGATNSSAFQQLPADIKKSVLIHICLILTAKILIINELHKDSVVKLHKMEDFRVHKLHKMDCF